MDDKAKIDQAIAELGDWRGAMLSAVRTAILSAVPDIVEEWKWMGSPTWSCDGMIAVGNAHKKKVKLTFTYGAHLADPKGLFNGDDKGNTRRSIDLVEGAVLDADALKDLVVAAIAYNRAHLKKNRPSKAGAKG
jgi:hypothetical protein